MAQSSLAWPPKGRIAALREAAADSSKPEFESTFRAGEVIVPMRAEDPRLTKQLQQMGISPGIDYRIMTLTDRNGDPLFSTKHLAEQERRAAGLATRPCGWKLQN